MKIGKIYKGCVRKWFLKNGWIRLGTFLSEMRPFFKTSSPMGNDPSPESQHNVGDTIIYDAQRQTVFNLGNLNGAIFIRFLMKIKHCPIFPHSHNGKDGPV